ncbi:unnamed protein product [Rotaria sp. Silwood2]|nr:unnamed protein product [Rotaria sp. Silwood2]CAF3160747.1 unnamed protein product [Rotaria sp. Silwood2]CAF3554114.1 unnamed protein product [Rotaria sp. Silwood2]CAF4503858.1 unnamed protein product [Rotaria sp. Silwood2]CAF4528006.1 unnamed protein product [Rotaria sp. Silwood2]
MAWSYPSYVEADALISAGILFVIAMGVLVIYRLERGKEFVSRRIIGIETQEAVGEDDGVGKDQGIQIVTLTKKVHVRWVAWSFAALAAMILSFTGMTFFQGCFLASARLFPNDECPDYPMDCFVSNRTHRIRFHCNPSSEAVFPGNITNQIAWCFGWVINLQTTKSILDQLGVCTGLMGLFTTVLAIIVYLGKSVITLVISVILFASGTVGIIISLEFKWSYSPLTVYVLVLGISLGIFGIVLYMVLPERKNDGLVTKSDTNPKMNNSNAPPTNLPSSNTKTPSRSSKVTPKPIEGGDVKL